MHLLRVAYMPIFAKGVAVEAVLRQSRGMTTEQVASLRSMRSAKRWATPQTPEK